MTGKYRNKKAQDPYQWLEEDSAETRKWIDLQDKKASKYLAESAIRHPLHKRFRKLLDVEVERLPTLRGDKYFFRKAERGKDQASIFVKSGLHGEPTLLLDPNKLSLGVLRGWNLSKDGKYIAIEFSKNSNDRQVIKIFDVISRKFLNDTISDERYPYFQYWKVDSSGFWYERGESGHPASEEKFYKRLYYHALGDPVEEDILFFGQNLAKEEHIGIKTSNDGRYELISVGHADRTSTIYFREILNPDNKFINITKGIKASSSARVEGEYIYLFTNHRAPNEKILRREIKQGSLGKWEEFVPETKHKLIGRILLKDKIFLEYIENVYSKFYVIDLNNGKKKEIKLPGVGSIGGYSSEYDGKELFFNFSSLDLPSSIYRMDLKTLNYKLYKKPSIKVPKNLEIIQEWSRSKDGTRIPMFILKKKEGGVSTPRRERSSPTLVYAYGGFNISLLPDFRASIIPFVEDGGIFVLANIRGGSEFGKKWHEAVIKKKQHKRFEDFASVLKHLVSAGYTAPDKLCVWGGSNGGLLMSVMALHYPELFKAALIDVPVADMLRFHLFHGGRHWIHEYGDPDDPKMRKYLLSYSPYHNVAEKKYPAMMIMTASHDDRVHPMHAFKFFAKLKENKEQINTIILRVSKKAGHGGAGKLKSNIDSLADKFTFVYKELGMGVER